MPKVNDGRIYNGLPSLYSCQKWVVVVDRWLNANHAIFSTNNEVSLGVIKYHFSSSSSKVEGGTYLLSACCTPGASGNLTEEPIRTAPPFDGHSLSRARRAFFFFLMLGASL